MSNCSVVEIPADWQNVIAIGDTTTCTKCGQVAVSPIPLVVFDPSLRHDRDRLKSAVELVASLLQGWLSEIEKLKGIGNG